jgi:5'-3' exonuclease
LKRGVQAVHDNIDPVVRDTQIGLDKLGIAWHQAPGEGEAECAALQRLKIVDAVWTRDGDAFIFGADIIYRPCKGKSPPTHVTVYDATKTEAGRVEAGKFEVPKILRTDAILVAMMSGGDYSAGLHGCGPETAWGISKQNYGFLGKLFYKIKPENSALVENWKSALKALLLNSGKSITLPNDFPDLQIRDHYKQPAVSSDAELQALDQSLWTHNIQDLQALWDFACQIRLAWPPLCQKNGYQFWRASPRSVALSDYQNMRSKRGGCHKSYHRNQRPQRTRRCRRNTRTQDSVPPWCTR